MATLVENIKADSGSGVLGGKQTTLKGEYVFEGRGLHTGANVSVRLLPAPADTGYLFVRVDLEGHPEIPAQLDLVTATERGTVLKKGIASAATVEHLLSALYGLGVHNARIELDGPEVPILDGSAAQVTRAIVEGGLEILDADEVVISLDGPVAYEADGRRILAEPCDCLQVEYMVDYGAAIGTQRVVYKINPETYLANIAQARTFCQEKEVEAMRAAGMIKGGTLDCAIVYGDDGPLNPPLRYSDEVVRHKLLDFIGDLALAGRRVLARFTIEKAGHYHHVEAMKALLHTVPPAPKPQSKRKRSMSEDSKKGEVLLNASEIEKLLPHRYPMALVDKIVEMDLGKRIVGVKNVTMNEWFFQGHFPGHPIMPGVLIVEAMAQVGGVLVMKSIPGSEGSLTYFMGIDKAKFRKPVVPGDSVRLEMTATRLKGKIAKLHGEAFVDGQLVCEADVTCMTVPREQS